MSKSFITNIAGTWNKNDLAKVGNAKSVNMFCESTNPSQDYISIIQRSIPGLSLYKAIEGTPRGTYTVSRGYNEQPVIYTVFDTSLYCIIEDEVYKIGELAQSSNICHFCETGGYGSAHPHLIIVDGVNVYAVNTGLDVGNQNLDFRTIQLPYRVESDTQYISPTHCAYLYGYLVVNDSGTDAFYKSYQYPFETLTEAGEIDYDLFETKKYSGKSIPTYSEWQPDKTLALCSNGSRLYTFGDRSYQVFTFNDNVNNPFVSPDTAAKLIGIKAVNSLAQLGEYTLWLGSADLGNNGVYLNTGSVDSNRVSTPEIEREISTFKYIKDAIAQIWQENQHLFYSITFPSEERTFVYDLKENAWHERCSLNNKNEKIAWRYNFATLSPEGDLLYSCKDALVKVDNTKWTEHDNTPILRSRTGGVIYSNYNNFFIDSITIEMNNGQMKNILGSDAYINMRYTADGSDWSDIETVNIGTTGSYDYDCTFYSFGMAKCFSIELSTTDDFPFALYGLKLESSECKF